jgi:hypothetical protein
MSLPTDRVAQLPWTSSLALGGEFVYLSRTDEIALKNGNRYARPQHVPAKSLDSAKFEGPLPFVYSGTPPGDDGSYVLENSRSRAFSAPASHSDRLATGVTPVSDWAQTREPQSTVPAGSPGSAYHFDSAMGPIMQMSGSKAKHTQSALITPGREPSTVLQPRTQGDAYRRGPVRPEDIVPGVPTGDRQKPSSLLQTSQKQLQRDNSRGPLHQSVQLVKSKLKGYTAQTKSDAKREYDQNEPTQCSQAPQDVDVFFTTPSAGQRQSGNSAQGPGNPASGPGRSGRIVPISNDDVLKFMFPDFAPRKSGPGDIGRIVLVLCRRPAVSSSVGPMWTPGIALSQTGGRVFAPVERYVIIDSGPPNGSYCVALPIKTYGGRGVADPTIIKSHHCILYTDSNASSPTIQEMPVRGEAGVRMPAVRVVLDDPMERLDPMSRVHLMGARALEDSERTRNFGRVSRQSERDLLDHFRASWRARPLPRPPPPPTRPQEGNNDDEDEEEDDNEEDGGEDEDSSDDGSGGGDQE